MPESISFDRAATFYDATRKLPEDLAAAVNEALLAKVRGAGADRVLEVGIGTGRIARPLMASGIRVTGVDISAQMMAQLQAQLGPEHTPPDLLLGDATRLPFRDAAFPAALVVHVFHLVASMADAIAEVRRVLTPGGILLQEFHQPDEGTRNTWREQIALWDGLFAKRGFVRPRRRVQIEDIDAALRESGATLETTAVAPAEEVSTVDEELDRVRNRIMSWTWQIPEDLLIDCLPEYEDWLRSISDSQGRFVDHVTYMVQTARWD